MIRSVPLNAQDIWINIEADALEKHPEWIEEFDLDDEIIEYIGYCEARLFGL